MSKLISELEKQQCSDLPAGAPALKHKQASAYMQKLEPQWQLNKQEQNISYTYSFKDYYQTMAFVNVVAQIAHQQNHHPDLFVSYNRCTVSYNTHSVNGLSINDFICAAKINAALNL